MEKCRSAYIHIPFCNTICSYCDFCKFLKNTEWVDKYLIELNKEISSTYKGEVLDTLYIGGGTPTSLDINELNRLFDTLKLFKLNNTYEFTFECNIESITEEKLKLLKENRVNRISIGVETFNDKHLNFLNRHHTKESTLKTIDLVKKYFDNINIDLMYAIPGETLKELESDIDILLSLNIPHISTYSLIIEENTKLYIDKTEYIDDELDSDMYTLIIDKLKDFNHYEVSNFSKPGFESKHNLTYWNNDNYYGFGCGSSGYIDNIRYDNTRSLTKYLKGEYIYTSNKLSKEETIQNEFILGLRKMKGINKNTFKSKYNIDIKSIDTVNKLLSENKIIEDRDNIFINPKYIYTSNYILEEFI